MEVNVKTIGGLIITCALVFLLLLFSFLNTLSDMSMESCSCGDSCDMKHMQIPLVFYGGLLGVIILLIVGFLLFFKDTSSQPGEKQKSWIKTLETLEPDEKEVYEKIIEEGGAIFQSELVEKTGQSKVKITRILDKLEAKNKLERKRRGLTNIVVLK